MRNKYNSIRDKEAKESYETDKQRMSNIKEAGIIGKRFLLVQFCLPDGMSGFPFGRLSRAFREAAAGHLSFGGWGAGYGVP